MTPMPRRGLALAASVLAGSVLAPGAGAQQPDCPLLCPPEFSVSPSFFVTRAFDAPRVRLLPSAAAVELESQTDFILFLNLLIPTTVPRTNVSFQLGWAPYAGRSVNPFTGTTPARVGEREIDANEPTLDMGLNFNLVRMQDTKGWAGLTFEVLDQYGPAQEPDDAGGYAHNLDLELDTTLGVFNWLPQGHYLKNVAVFAELDLLVTGLAEEGDEVPFGEQVFLEDDSPWTFIAGVTLPVAPLIPAR